MAAKDRQLDELMAAAQLHAQEKEAVTRTLRAQIQVTTVLLIHLLASTHVCTQ